jgi:hypothetical protein
MSMIAKLAMLVGAPEWPKPPASVLLFGFEPSSFIDLDLFRISSFDIRISLGCRPVR